jgi:hypothetical protein
MSASVSSGSTASKIRWGREIYEGMVADENDLNALMSKKGSNGIIQIEETNAGDGMTYRTHFLEEVSNADWNVGDARLSGVGRRLTVATDDVVLQRERVATLIENLTETDIRTAFDFDEAVMRKLKRAGAKRIQNNILSALAQPSTGTIQGRTISRYIYGNSNANWNTTHTTALATVNNTAGKLTFAGLDAVLHKARNQGSNRSFLRPAEVMLTNGVKEKAYVALLHPLAVRDLLQSTPAQGQLQYREAPQWQFIKGSYFVGFYRGIAIYEQALVEPTIDPLLEIGVGASGINVSHNLLLGQNAAVLSFGQVRLAQGTDIVAREQSGRIVVTREVQDHGGNTELGMTMVMGTKKLVDSTVSAEDNGVVHFFNAAVE